ncbi:hypothetical protein DF268_07060 [Streptomyces sp. V2]|nr:hypothetical protein DF268_07060 [Streptomyces sp. V2]
MLQLFPALLPPAFPALLPPALFPPALLPPALLSEQVASVSTCCRPIAVPVAWAMRLMVATRLSLSGFRIAFCAKFAPPCPTDDARRLFAS